MEDLISVKTVARRLDLSTRTVHRMLDAGDLPSILLGRQRRKPLVDFNLWVQARIEDARGAQRNRKVVPIA